MAAKLTDTSQKILGHGRLEIADRGAWEKNRYMIGFAQRFGQLQLLEVIGADWKNFERGHGVAQLDRGIDEALLRNIDRNVGDGIFELFEQQPRLDSRAGPKTDQRRIRPDGF